MKKAIFLDRDGVVNKVIIRGGTPSSPWNIGEFELLPGIQVALKEFKKMGFLNIIFTNQPDVARGFLTIQELEQMHNVILRAIPVNEITFCPHDNADNCLCRKPKPGMLIMAAKKWGIDLKNSYVIGDGIKDIEAGKAAGCKTFLIKKPYNKKTRKTSDFIVSNLGETINIIKNQS